MVFILFLMLTFYLAITLRIIGLGMSLKQALVCSFTYPLDVLRFHIKMGIFHKNIPLRKRLSILVAPFLNTSDTIVTYAKTDMLVSDRYKAIVQLLKELNVEEQKQLLKGLENDGIIQRKSLNSSEKKHIIETSSGTYSIKRFPKDRLKGA